LLAETVAPDAAGRSWIVRPGSSTTRPPYRCLPIVRDRYLKYVEEDLETFGGRVDSPRRQESGLGCLSEALPRLWAADRILGSASTPPKRKAPKKSTITTVLEFANTNLEKETKDGLGMWTRTLLDLSIYSQDRRNFGCSLGQIQKEVREILRDLAAGHPWASSEEYARLAHNRSLDCEDAALNLFSLGSTGATISPISIGIAWDHGPEGISENIIPWDPRSCLIMAIRAEIRKENPPCVLKCPVSRTFFVRTSRRQYCSDECRARGNELLRDREKRNAQRRKRYWEDPVRAQRAAEIGTTRASAD
jgi:hypothetical protein